MFHSIAADGQPITDDTTVSASYFKRFMEYARQLGFETITIRQLVEFLTTNASIPPRSMLLIVDDRKRASFFETYFEPYHKKYGWTVINSWISHPDTPAYLYAENEKLARAGWVEYQAHGARHNDPLDAPASDDYIYSEITTPLEVIAAHFGQKPAAFIWPRGLFTPKAVDVAWQAGYQVGFTVYARGPLLFNGIPQGKEELSAAEPLLLLPRYWSPSAIPALDEALKISQLASEFAVKNYSQEKGYFQTYCQQP